MLRHTGQHDAHARCVRIDPGDCLGSTRACSADNCARVITTEGALELLVLCCAANATNPDLQHQSVWVLCNLSQPIGAALSHSSLERLR